MSFKKLSIFHEKTSTVFPPLWYKNYEICKIPLFLCMSLHVLQSAHTYIALDFFVNNYLNGSKIFVFSKYSNLIHH